MATVNAHLLSQGEETFRVRHSKAFPSSSMTSQSRETSLPKSTVLCCSTMSAWCSSYMRRSELPSVFSYLFMVYLHVYTCHRPGHVDLSECKVNVAS